MTSKRRWECNEDMKKEEAATLHEKPLTDTVSLDSTMLALQDVISGKKKLSVDDFTGLVAPLIEKLDAVLPEDSKHVLRNLLSSHTITDTSVTTDSEATFRKKPVTTTESTTITVNAIIIQAAHIQHYTITWISIKSNDFANT